MLKIDDWRADIRERLRALKKQFNGKLLPVVGKRGPKMIYGRWRHANRPDWRLWRSASVLFALAGKRHGCPPGVGVEPADYWLENVFEYLRTPDSDNMGRLRKPESAGESAPAHYRSLGIDRWELWDAIEASVIYLNVLLKESPPDPFATLEQREKVIAAAANEYGTVRALAEALRDERGVHYPDLRAWARKRHEGFAKGKAGSDVAEKIEKFLRPYATFP